MTEIIRKSDVLNKIYSKEIEKINNSIREVATDSYRENGVIFITFNEIFEVPEKANGTDCINIAELLRKNGWKVEISNGINNIEDSISEKGWSDNESGWAVS